MSMKLTPAAFWRTSASPGFGVGSGASSNVKASGPPTAWTRMAFMVGTYCKVATPFNLLLALPVCSSCREARKELEGQTMANLPLANIFNRKTRTSVGILAVALGVATVLVMVGLAQGSLD